MRVRWPIITIFIRFTRNDGASAYLVAHNAHRSRAIQHQHPIKFEMADDDRYISEQCVPDREHLLDIRSGRHHTVTADAMIGKIRQAREIDLNLPARASAVDPPPQQWMIQGLRSVRADCWRFKPMGLSLPGVNGQRLMGAGARVNGGPIWFESVAPGLAQRFQQCPFGGKSAL